MTDPEEIIAIIIVFLILILIFGFKRTLFASIVASFLEFITASLGFSNGIIQIVPIIGFILSLKLTGHKT